MKIKSPSGIEIEVPDSKAVDHGNHKRFVGQVPSGPYAGATLDVTLNWNADSNSGYNQFTYSAELSQGTVLQIGRCVEEIGLTFPHLKELLPYHLVGTNGPMYYFENTMYLAGVVDHWGCREGEQQTSRKSGLPIWALQESPYTRIEATEQPQPLVLQWHPILGEGKPADPAAARACLENVCSLTDEELELESEELKQLILSKAPNIHQTTLANVVYHAGTRDCFGTNAGEQRKCLKGLPLWHMVERPYRTVSAADKPEPIVLEFFPLPGVGKERELNNARGSAVWPDASDEELSVPPAELEKALAARLPKLLEGLKCQIEQLGFQY
ncbi:hypothetical protein LC612_42480 [Nostoc sp. CHAB 5834]|nr:hypothetical protein [Nostoc sp. CHAB 5834]